MPIEFRVFFAFAGLVGAINGAYAVIDPKGWARSSWTLSGILRSQSSVEVVQVRIFGLVLSVVAISFLTRSVWDLQWVGTVAWLAFHAFVILSSLAAVI